MLDMLFFSGKFWAAAAPAANPTVQVSFQKNSPTQMSRATLKMAPHLKDQRTIAIILPNTIHGCKRKDL